MKYLSGFSGFSVKDLSTAKQFYEGTLGLKVDQDDMGLSIQIPGSDVKVFVYQKEDHQPATFTILNLVVENIDAAVDELTGKGVSFERYDNLPAPQDNKGVLRGLAAGMGPDIAWFKDPSDNILGLLQDKK